MNRGLEGRKWSLIIGTRGLEKTGRKVIKSKDGSILKERGARNWRQTEGKQKLGEITENLS